MGGYDGLALAMYDTNDQSFVNKGADNFFSITITDATTMTSGYIQPFHTSITSTGSKTGGQSGVQVNAFAADIALGATQTAWVAGVYIYVCEASSAATMTDSTLSGYEVYFDTIGSACDYRMAFHCSSAETSSYNAASMDTGLMVECSGTTGTWGSMLGVMGYTLPLYFLKVGDYTAADRMICASDGMTSAAAYTLKCYLKGAVYNIPLYLDSCA